MIISEWISNQIHYWGGMRKRYYSLDTCGKRWQADHRGGHTKLWAFLNSLSSSENCLIRCLDWWTLSVPCLVTACLQLGDSEKLVLAFWHQKQETKSTQKLHISRLFLKNLRGKRSDKDECLENSPTACKVKLFFSAKLSAIWDEWQAVDWAARLGGSETEMRWGVGLAEISHKALASPPPSSQNYSCELSVLR